MKRASQRTIQRARANPLEGFDPKINPVRPRANTHKKPSRAVAYASGHIHILGWHAGVPNGALPIAIGPEEVLRSFISGVARHARDSDDLFIPGVPESDAEHLGGAKAYDAMIRWLDLIREPGRKAGLEVF